MPFLSVLLASLLSAAPASGDAWLVGSDQSRDASEAAIFAARPGERIELASIGVLENYAPILRLSPSGQTLFILRQTVPNHPQGTGEILALDLKTRALRTIAAGADADPFLALSDSTVAYLETLNSRPQEGDFDHVTLSVTLSADGERRELARLDGIYGAALAGASSIGLILYVVGLEEAAFYLLPIDETALSGGLMRIARAPTGPFAREFAVHGRSLFFSARSPGDGIHRLYELELPDLDEVLHPERRVSRRAVPVAVSGIHSPKAVLARDGSLVHASFGSTGSQLVAREAPRKALPGGRPAKAFLQSRGTLTPIALDAPSRALVLRRSFGGSAELLWTSPDGQGGMRRIPVREFHETAGFTWEVAP